MSARPGSIRRAHPRAFGVVVALALAASARAQATAVPFAQAGERPLALVVAAKSLGADVDPELDLEAAFFAWLSR